LSPYEYGLFGMVYIFIVISGIFIDGGLSLALIREEKVTEEEYSTVFFYNLFISISIYLILFFSAKLISLFFNEPSLVVIIRVIGVSIILGALTSIQKTKLIKELKFKLQVKIEFISLILSSSLAILFAYFDYGVWALVFMYLSKSIISTFLLIVNLKWIPILKFNNNAFKKFFNFGYKMLVTGLIAKSYHTIYDLLIGRFYSTEILGLFTKSKVLKDNITTLVFDSVAKVGLPTLSRIKSDQNQFRNGFKFMIKHVSFFSFPLIFGISSDKNNLSNWVQNIYNEIQKLNNKQLLSFDEMIKKYTTNICDNSDNFYIILLLCILIMCVILCLIYIYISRQ
jgi:O-antigen/teichoic acid export membrane protein